MLEEYCTEINGIASGHVLQRRAFLRTGELNGADSSIAHLVFRWLRPVYLPRGILLDGESSPYLTESASDGPEASNVVCDLNLRPIGGS